MARTWWSVTVELLGGRGEQLWPWPGRAFAVGPAHTFMDLADAVNAAFARWDRAHLSVFTLADGRVITDAESGEEMASAAGGPVLTPLDISATKIAEAVDPGGEFQYVFDLGDGWTHRCVLEAEMVDPVEVLGVRPDAPLAYWGWGSMPDQYGRRWADDDGQGRTPRRPNRPHPMLLGSWPGRDQLPELDLSEVRAAIAAEDPQRFIAAVSGREIDDALQQVGPGLQMALEGAREEVESLALSVVNRLLSRGAVGDEVLAEDLLAGLRREPLAGRVVSVDLEILSALQEGDSEYSSGGYLDLHTGRVSDDSATDPGMVGEDAAIDVEADPDRWLWFDRTGSRDGWRDMSAFAELQRDATLRDRLERAIEGKGAFRRFRDLVHDEGLAGQWRTLSDERRLGRAREYLAAEGIRVGWRRPAP